MRVSDRTSLRGNSMAPSQGRDGRTVGVEPSSSGADNRAYGVSTSSSLSNSMSWNTVRDHVLNAGMLWLVGFKEACQFHRAISFCKRSRPVFIRTGQCFFLNGCIFLGSILVLQCVIVPMLGWLMGSPVPIAGERGDGNTGLLQTIVVVACYVFWLYPIYIVSFVVNIIWYNDIAKHAFQIMDRSGAKSQSATADLQMPKAGKGNATAKTRLPTQNNSGIQSTVLRIGEQIYSVIMVTAFFLEVFAVSYIPYVGPVLNFIFLSWLYAYYCFDYKWGFSGWNLEERLLFFETNWAFFAGFGSPCVFATFFLSQFVSAGVMNVLFPLFVLVATASNPEEAVLRCVGSKDSGRMTRRLPIFYFATYLTVPLLSLLQPARSSMPSSIQSKRRGT